MLGVALAAYGSIVGITIWSGVSFKRGAGRVRLGRGTACGASTARSSRRSLAKNERSELKDDWKSHILRDQSAAPLAPRSIVDPQIAAAVEYEDLRVCQRLK